MFKFTALDSQPKQKITMLLEDNSKIEFYFEYKPNLLGWFFGFVWGQYDVRNLRLTTNYNILSSFAPYLPFGLRCDTEDNLEPYDIDDFSKGYASLYLLTKNDVKLIDEKYYSRSEAINV